MPITGPVFREPVGRCFNWCRAWQLKAHISTAETAKTNCYFPSAHFQMQRRVLSGSPRAQASQLPACGRPSQESSGVAWLRAEEETAVGVWSILKERAGPYC